MSTLRARREGLFGPLLTGLLILACSHGGDDGSVGADPAQSPAGGSESVEDAGWTYHDPRTTGTAQPAAEIEWPAEGSAHRTVRLDVRGTARGVEQVFVNGRATPVDADGRWTADVDLPAGMAEIVVHAPPRGAGEPARLALRQIVVDLEAPVISLDQAPGTALDAPPGARLVGGTSIQIDGRVDDSYPGRPDTLTLDDEPCVLGDGGAFHVTVELEAEGETTLRLAAADAAGNRARLALVVVRDTTPPTLDVTPPTAAELEQRSDDRIVVHGRVVDEHARRLLADGDAVELAPDGSFELEVDLGGGARTIELVGEDAAGNRSQPLPLELASDR